MARACAYKPSKNANLGGTWCEINPTTSQKTRY